MNEHDGAPGPGAMEAGREASPHMRAVLTPRLDSFLKAGGRLSTPLGPMSGTTQVPQTETSTSALPGSNRLYRAQFSSSTQAILERMKTESQASSTASNGATHREALANSTLPMPHSITDDYRASQTPTPDQPWQRLSQGSKRKRDARGDAVQFEPTQSTVALPESDLTGTTSQPSLDRLYKKAKSSRLEKCHGCEVGIPVDPIVKCKRCFKIWHRACANDAEDLSANHDSPQFLCKECSSSNQTGTTKDSEPTTERGRRIEYARDERIANLPRKVVPPKRSLIGFQGGAVSDYLRTEYFYGKKKSELLNLLSFCDQLKPQLLVDMLVSISKKHPDLPIFESPDWAAQTATALGESLAINLSKPKASRHGHVLLDKSRSRNKGPPRKSLKQDTQNQSGGEESPDDDDGDNMPATWPKAGEGLYARLKVEVEDRSFLTDENDGEAFSHFMVDRLGRQVVEPV